MDPNKSVQSSGISQLSPSSGVSAPISSPSSLSSSIEIKTPSSSPANDLRLSESPNLTKDGKVKKKYDSSRRIGVKRGSYKKSYDKQALIGKSVGNAHLSDDESSKARIRANSLTKRNSISSMKRNSHSAGTPVYVNEDRNLNYGGNFYLFNNSVPSSGTLYQNGNSSLANTTYITSTHEIPQVYISSLPVSQVATQPMPQSRGIPIPITASRKSSVLSNSYNESPIQSLSNSICYEPHQLQSGTPPQAFHTAGTPPQQIHGPTSYGYLNVNSQNSIGKITTATVTPDNTMYGNYINRNQEQNVPLQQQKYQSNKFIDVKMSPSTPSVTGTPPVRYASTFSLIDPDRRGSSNETIAYDTLNGYSNVTTLHNSNQQTINVNANPNQAYLNMNGNVNQNSNYKNGMVIVDKSFYQSPIAEGTYISQNYSSFPPNEENSLVSENDVFYVPHK